MSRGGIKMKNKMIVVCDKCKKEVEIERDFETCDRCGFILNHEIPKGEN
jgi:rRNA maturation endonuclease Nob1